MKTSRGRSLRGAAVAALACAVCLVPFSLRAMDGPHPGKPRPGDPQISLPLDTLGFDAPSARLLAAGATMYTLNFVDDTHLLFTFNSHGLIPRTADGPANGDDRLVKALLLELPTGRVLASTQWHTRDHEQYLYPLSQGQFLLRIQSKLTLLEPMQNLAAGDAFRQQPFLEFQRRIAYVAISPGGDLLTVETLPPRKSADTTVATLPPTTSTPDPGAGGGTIANTSGVPPLHQRPAFTVPIDPVTNPQAEIRFYRLMREPGAATAAQSAGALLAESLLRIPATSEGFLMMTRESDKTWLFDFHSHDGKKVELSLYDTTCTPKPFFVSRSEFVALGCAGSSNKAELSGFNFRGEEPWLMVLSGNQIAPEIISAPDAGRLAFSRVSVASTFYDMANLAPEEISGQEIQILQHHDGRVLLKTQAQPAQRAGQNFDLSPDGMSFTVIHNGSLDVYKLPPLSKKDQEQLALAAKDVPERTTARIRLSTPEEDAAARPAQAAETVVVPVNAGAASAAAQSAAMQGPPAQSTAAQAPPSQINAPDEPRKPPTLYSPEYPKQN